MTKIAVLDDWQGVAQSSADWSPLSAHAEVVFFAQAFDDEDDAAAKLADFEIVLSMRERTPLPGSLINRLPMLRMLGITGARNASLDTTACTARSIPVCNTAGGAGAEAATAELALGLLLAAARAIPAADANMRAGRFQEGLPVGISLAGKTIGIIGLGRLGSSMASYCRGAEHDRLGMEREPDRGTGASGRRHLGFERSTLIALRCGQHPPGTVTALARSDRCLRHRHDETGRDSDQYVARSDR